MYLISVTCCFSLSYCYPHYYYIIILLSMNLLFWYTLPCIYCCCFYYLCLYPICIQNLTENLNVFSCSCGYDIYFIQTFSFLFFNWALSVRLTVTGFKRSRLVWINTWQPWWCSGWFLCWFLSYCWWVFGVVITHTSRWSPCLGVDFWLVFVCIKNLLILINSSFWDF